MADRTEGEAEQEVVAWRIRWTNGSEWHLTDDADYAAGLEAKPDLFEVEALVCG